MTVTIWVNFDIGGRTMTRAITCMRRSRHQAAAVGLLPPKYNNSESQRNPASTTLASVTVRLTRSTTSMSWVVVAAVCDQRIICSISCAIESFMSRCMTRSACCCHSHMGTCLNRYPFANVNETVCVRLNKIKLKPHSVQRSKVHDGL